MVRLIPDAELVRIGMRLFEALHEPGAGAREDVEMFNLVLDELAHRGFDVVVQGGAFRVLRAAHC